eukprot:5002269-Prorocentrum_lima.AAC.1
MECRTLLVMATKNQWTIGGLYANTASWCAGKEHGVILVQPPSIQTKSEICPPDVLWNPRAG